MELFEIKQSREAFQKRLEDIEQLLDVEALKKTIHSLEEKTYDNHFWDDHSEAQKTIQTLKRQKKRLQSYEELRERLENLDVAIELLEMEETVDEIEHDIKTLEKRFKDTETMLYLAEEYDASSAILEIHPGAGGTESHDWALMLYRMYRRYAERQGFSFTVNDYQEGGEAGLKNATLSVEGEYAYGLLKSEHGVHRLVRLSPFDSSNRRHTSFAGVSVIPVLEETADIEIKDDDIRIDTFRSSGAGGQSVNTTDSAVRITHLETGVTVSCQNERSQIKNREQAMKILRAKLHRIEKEKKADEIERLRGGDISNAFGSQIRSYVMHPYTMVKDHRTDEETAQVQKVLDGELEPFVHAYLKTRLKEGEDDA